MEERILEFVISAEEAGQTIRSFLMQRLSFSAHQLSRLKYRERGITVDGAQKYVVQRKINLGGEYRNLTEVSGNRLSMALRMESNCSLGKMITIPLFWRSFCIGLPSARAWTCLSYLE